MGRALGMAGDIAGALETNHKGLAIEEESVAEDPTNGTYRRGLEISYSNDGYYRDRLGDKRGAVESYRKGIAISEQLVAADSSDTSASDDLAQEYQQVADSLAALGDNAQALLNYQKSLKLFDDVLVNAPEDLRRRLLLAVSRAGVGKMQARLGQRASAVEECRMTVSLLRETREDPANSNHRSLKAQAYVYLGEAYAALAAATEGSTTQVTQLWTAARDMFQQSLGICEDMHSRGILAPPDTPQIGEVAGEIAKCDAALRK
jgi:tetratricopeptide (TPR) repeat protein